MVGRGNDGHFSVEFDTGRTIIMHCGFFVLLAFAALFVAKIEAADYEAELDTNFTRSERRCSSYFSSSLQKAWLLVLGKLGDNIDTSPTKCWISCVLQKMGLKGKPLENNFHPENMKLSEMDENMAINAKICETLANKESDLCERGYIYVECMFNKWHQSIDDDIESLEIK